MRIETLPNYIELRRKTWFAVKDVPQDVKESIGKTRFVKSLKTRDKRIALSRVGAVIAQWELEIDLARGMSDTLAQARIWAARRKGLSENSKGLHEIDDHIGDIAQAIEDQGQIIGHDEDGQPIRDTTASATIFYRVATNKLIETSEYLDKWLADKSITASTAAEYRSVITTFSHEYKFVQDVTKSVARAWVDNLKVSGLARDTIGKKLVALQGYWVWLAEQGYIEDAGKTPWDGLRPKKGGGTDDVPKRAAIPDEVGARLLSQIRDNSALHPDDYPIALIMAATGMRLEEVCRLRVSDVAIKEGVAWLMVRKTKTQSGIRRLPIIDTRTINIIQARLLGKAGGDLVFSSLKESSEGKFSKLVSNRFGRRLEELKLPEEQAKGLVGAHGWRHRAATLLEQGDIQPHIMAWFNGHKRQGESLGRYSKGPSDAQLIEAAKTITIPEH